MPDAPRPANGATRIGQVVTLAVVFAPGCSRQLGDPAATGEAESEPGDQDTSDGDATTSDVGPSTSANPDSDTFDGIRDEDGLSSGGDEDLGDLPIEPRCAPPDTTDETRIRHHSGVVLGDEYWSCDFVHVLDHPPVVVRDGTLAIEAGTTVRSDQSDLFIDTTGRLEAVGSRTEPIVFTSQRLVDDPAALGPGAWGGITLLGAAPTNCGSDCRGPARDEDNPVEFGGLNETHDCGRLEYVRIEFAGEDLDDHPQFALGLLGCGSDTLVDGIQLHQSGGDGLVLAGGSASVSHVIVSTAGRHGVVLRSGYQGVVQFHVGLSDADATGDLVRIEPGPDVRTARATAAGLANLTLIGDGGSPGVSAHGEVTFDLRNSIVLHRGQDDFLRFGDDASCLSYLGTGAGSTAECVLAEGTLGSPESPLCPVSAVESVFDSSLANDRSQSESSLGFDASAVPPRLQPSTTSLAAGMACPLTGAYASQGEYYFGAVDPLGNAWPRDTWTRWD